MRRVWGFVLAGLVVSALLAALVSPFASETPEVLEKVAQDKGFAAKGEGAPAWRFPLMPDYAVPGVRSKALATGLAGLAGTVVVFGVALGAAKLIARRRRTTLPQRGALRMPNAECRMPNERHSEIGNRH